MSHGPFSPLYLPRPIEPLEAAENALRAILGTTEATWLHSQGERLFKIDLAGIVDDEKRVNRYLKVRR